LLFVNQRGVEHQIQAYLKDVNASNTFAADQVKVGQKMIAAVQEVLKTDKEQEENP